MEFKLNRNNKILEVKIRNIMDQSEKELYQSSMELNPSSISTMEEVLNGTKVPDEDTFIMIEKMELSEEEYASFHTSGIYEMKASALTLSVSNIYCFELFFGKVTLERIGNKKKTNDKMVLKNVKIKLWEDGKYSVKEVSGLVNQQEKEVTVSVSAGDHLSTMAL